MHFARQWLLISSLTAHVHTDIGLKAIFSWICRIRGLKSCSPVVVRPGTCLYLANDINLIVDSGRRLLRSASARTCVVQRHRTVSATEASALRTRVYGIVCRLPSCVRTYCVRTSATDSLHNFWKHFYFGVWWPRRIVTILHIAPYKHSYKLAIFRWIWVSQWSSRSWVVTIHVTNQKNHSEVRNLSFPLTEWLLPMDWTTLPLCWLSDAYMLHHFSITCKAQRVARPVQTRLQNSGRYCPNFIEICYQT